MTVDDLARNAAITGRVVVHSTPHGVRRRVRSVWHRVLRLAVLVTAVEVFVFFYGYGMKPGGPFGPDPSLSCGPATAAESVAGQSVVVVMARTQGRALRRLAGPPPDPRATHAAAERAADAVVVSVLALKASLRGQREPAKVTAYNAAATRRHEQQLAATAALCGPCPIPGATPAGAPQDGPGTTTVAATGSGVEIATRAAAAAGFTGPDLDVAVAVAGAESGWQPTVTHRNRNGTTDHGMWQINSVHADVLASGNWRDPYANARMARTVWQRAGGSWTPWTTYRSGAYRGYLPSAAAATSRGVQLVADGTVCAPGPSGLAAGTAVAAGPWGGYFNGRIPMERLCHTTFDARALARCDAAAALDRLDTAYRARFGRHLSITDSYRDYAAQVACRAGKGNCAPTPAPPTTDGGSRSTSGAASRPSAHRSTPGWPRTRAGTGGPTRPGRAPAGTSPSPGTGSTPARPPVAVAVSHDNEPSTRGPARPRRDRALGAVHRVAGPALDRGLLAHQRRRGRGDARGVPLLPGGARLRRLRGGHRGHRRVLGRPVPRHLRPTRRGRGGMTTPVDVTPTGQGVFGRLPVTAGMARELAVAERVCVHPVMRTVTDRLTGTTTTVPIACGSTRESRCPSCGAPRPHPADSAVRRGLAPERRTRGRAGNRPRRRRRRRRRRAVPR
jgi:hypothetical protein